MSMIHPGGVLPIVDDVLDNRINPHPMFHWGENDWTITPHTCCVPFHDLQISTHGLSQVRFVNDEEVGLGDAGPALARVAWASMVQLGDCQKNQAVFLGEAGDCLANGLVQIWGEIYGIPSDEIRPQGNRSVNARFKNLFPHARHGFRDLLRWKLRGSTRPGQSEPFSAPIHAENLSRQGDDGATWIGHASFLLRLEGRVLLVDPVFSDHCAPFRIPGLRRTAPPGVSWSEAAQAEGVLITHNHYDHLDRPTISKLPGAIQFFVPTGVGRWMERVGKRNIREFGWWESWTWNGWKVTAVPAQHFSSRTLWDRNRTLWCGWILETEKKRIYLAGDTGYCPVFREIGDRFGPMDLAIIPIGAYEPRWFMKPMHVSPEEAIQIHLDTRARKSVASHWGTFRLTDEPLGEPPVRLRAGLEAAKLTVGEFVVPKIGETILF